MKFTNVHAQPQYPNGVLVQWDLEEAIDPGTYKFFVEKSGSVEGPFEPLHALPLLNEYTYLDVAVGNTLLTKDTSHLFYRVRVISPVGKELFSKPTDLLRNLEQRQFYIAREIMRKETLRFRKKVGVLLFVFKRRHFGDACTCIDPVTDDVLDSECTSCYGTRFVGGYYPPVEMWGEVTSYIKDKKIDPQGFGMIENYGTAIRLIAAPLLRRGDLIVERENRRAWNVMDVQNAELRTIPVVQLIGGRLISPSDIEHRIPIDEHDSVC